MPKFITVTALFVIAGQCEIGGGYLVWSWLRDNKPLAWALAGAVILALYGVVAALQPIPEFGRVYAAYGGIFIAIALAWGIVVDGFRPDRYDYLGDHRDYGRAGNGVRTASLTREAAPPRYPYLQPGTAILSVTIM